MKGATVLAAIAAFALAGCNITAPPGPRVASSIANAGFRTQAAAGGDLAFICDEACGGLVIMMMRSQTTSGENGLTLEEIFKRDWPQLRRLKLSTSSGRNTFTITANTYDVSRSLHRATGYSDGTPRIYVTIVARVRGNEVRFLGAGALTAAQAQRYARPDWLD